MKVGRRVRHKVYGDGVIIRILCGGTRRECYVVRFDNINEKLHNYFGITEGKHCYVLEEKDLEIIKGN